MNDRIKELEKQCWNHQTWQLDAEKFAELIILECASIVDNDSTLTGIVGADLKEHFGIQ